MSLKLRVKSTAVTYISPAGSNKSSDFYLNGRTISENNKEASEISSDKVNDQFFTALFENFEDINEDNKESFLVDKLNNCAKELNVNESNINENISKIMDYIDEAYIEISSANKYNEDVNKPALSGLYIFKNKCQGVLLGGGNILKFSNNSIDWLFSSRASTEKLKKLGIITDEQANMIDIDNKTLINDEMRVSKIFNVEEDDIYVLFSEDVTVSLDDETILSILKYDCTQEDMAWSFAKSAAELFQGGNISVIITKIISIDEDIVVTETKKHTSEKKHTEEKKSNVDIKNDLFAEKVLDMEQSQYKNVDPKIIKRNYLIKKIAGISAVFLVLFTLVIGLYNIFGLFFNASKDLEDNNQNESAIVEENNNTENEDSTNEDVVIPVDDIVVDIVDETIEDILENFYIDHVVSSGETLWSIAVQYYSDGSQYTKIIGANDLTDEEISVGQILKIPTGTD